MVVVFVAVVRVRRHRSAVVRGERRIMMVTVWGVATWGEGW